MTTRLSFCGSQCRSNPFAHKVVIAGLSAVAAFLNSLHSLFGYQEKYGKFEVSAQLLQSLCTKIDFHCYSEPSKEVRTTIMPTQATARSRTR